MGSSGGTRRRVSSASSPASSSAMRATRHESSAAPSCLTTSTNQYSSPPQSDQRKAEPLDRVRQVRTVVERGRGPTPRQSPRRRGGGRFELNDEREKTDHSDVAAAARRNQGNTSNRHRIKLSIERMIDVKCVGRGHPTPIDQHC